MNLYLAVLCVIVVSTVLVLYIYRKEIKHSLKKNLTEWLLKDYLKAEGLETYLQYKLERNTNYVGLLHKHTAETLKLLLSAKNVGGYRSDGENQVYETLKNFVHSELRETVSSVRKESQFNVDAHIKSEEFIDKIINRINCKQIN
jgi:hypothetical protein